MNANLLTTRKRNGATIQEALVAILIVAAVLVGVTQLLAMVASQRRSAQLRSLAAREAGNLMEDLMTRPWSDLTPDTLAKVQLSEPCLQRLPDAELQIEVSAEDDTDQVRRVDIRIDWANAADQRCDPVRLVAWRFHDEEAGS